MGEVWRAQHRFLARPAAIKLIPAEALGCKDSKETAVVKRRFEREAQATAMLSSPHTIHLYDFGLTADGAFYYVMELLRGLDLHTLIERYGPVPVDRAAQWLIQACSSLEEAHRAGLVHRDIKPANLYICHYGLEYDFLKVLDFGIVKSKRDPQVTSDTIAESTSGTPGFMAPEIAMGAKDVDGRADIYALGCVAYWLVTGRLVFEEETSMATLLAHAQKPPIPPSRRTEIPIPAAFEDLIMACLEKDPNRRPQTAADLARAVSESGADRSWTPERAEKWWLLHLPEASGPPLQVETARAAAS
jgi:serine/threonine-protein kinase